MEAQVFDLDDERRMRKPQTSGVGLVTIGWVISTIGLGWAVGWAWAVLAAGVVVMAAGVAVWLHE